MRPSSATSPRNPTFGLGKIKVDQTPTDYFPPHEFDKIVDATYAYRENRGEIGNTNSTRLRIMTLLMRWSGLRIRDAVTLEKTRLHGDSLLLYQAKTGTPVYVPLPSFLVESLRELPPGPKPNPRYFFWSGNGLAKSAVANWQRSFRRLFTLADIRRPDGVRETLPPTYVPRHVRGRDAAGGRTDRSGFDPARPRQRKDHRKALLSLGQSSPDSASAECSQRVACGAIKTHHQRDQSKTAQAEGGCCQSGSVGTIGTSIVDDQLSGRLFYKRLVLTDNVQLRRQELETV